MGRNAQQMGPPDAAGGTSPAAGSAGEHRSGVTLDELLAKLPVEVVVVHDGGSGSGLLRWVEPSELEDPTPYLLDGEFLLTAGLPFVGGAVDSAGDAGDAGDAAGGASAVDAYVRRLVKAGVVALGFGLEPYFSAVPDPVLAACVRHNLTLVQVPSTVPFAAIGLEFSRLLESDNAKLFRHLADTNRQLMRAVLSARPEHELLAALAQRVPVWAILIGADGRVRARAGSGVETAALQPLLGRLLGGSGPRVEMESLDRPGSRLVFGHPLRSTRDANLGALVLGTDTPLTPAQNSVVSSAVGLLELLVRQRTSGSLAPSQLATSLLLHPDSLSAGGARQLNGLRDLLAQSTSSTRSAPLRIVQGVSAGQGVSAAQGISAGQGVSAAQGSGAEQGIRSAQAAGQAAGRAADSPVRELLQWRRLFDTKLVELTDYGFAAITRLRVDDALLAEVEKLGWRLVIGDPSELTDLGSAYQRVTALRQRVQSTGKSARVGEVTWTVAGLLGQEAGTMLAARLLEPVLSQDSDRRTAHLSVLRAWLGENGNWDASAKALGLHRNSVRRQINAVAELLDTDLNQAQVRAELWIALQYVDGLPAP
ncbi:MULTISPECIES: PucR family transcriptional regulator [unclassified Arthrobacter]|uniref:PucR family transcriptional regulator n=1 Tax=unclassified Arthrobacter TaxID=235627 RepID=UPI001F204F3E|nr:PucR family transcriptional regulator [Arthrobacter sp. FW305-BF8]UKA55603.1 PucR family transcriptional regulator [Arthrobacter sp. FW305-BF8]